MKYYFFSILCPALIIWFSPLPVDAGERDGEEVTGDEIVIETPPVVVPYISYVYDYFHNVSGGLQTGGAGMGLFDVGFEVDLDEALGWDRTAFAMSAFARASIAPDEDRSVATQYVDGGIAFSNVVFEDSRLGLGAPHTIFGDDYISTDPGVTSSETVVEATRLIPISENFSVQPDIQYILDSHFSGRDALVIGLPSVVSF